MRAGRPPWLPMPHKEPAKDRRLFEQGIAVVREHGRLTPLGEAIIQGAEDYLASA